MSTLAVLGNDGMDIAVSIAILLTKLGQPTSIIDLSPDKRLLETLDIPETLKHRDVTKYNDVLCVSRSEDLSEMPDAVNVIKYFGPNVVDPEIKKCDYALLTTDMKVEHIKNLAKAFTPEVEDGDKRSVTKLVITHYIKKARYDKNFILRLITKPFGKKDVHVITYNEDDYLFRLSIGNSRLKFSSLSAEMRDVIVAVMTEYFATELDKRTASALFKN